MGEKCILMLKVPSELDFSQVDLNDVEVRGALRSKDGEGLATLENDGRPDLI